MYYYIIHSTDNTIELCKTEDILSIPESAELIDRTEIGNFFPRYTNREYQGFRHTILHGQFAGTYLLPLDTNTAGRLVNYEVARTKFEDCHLHALDRYVKMIPDKAHCEVNGLVQYYSFDLSDIIQHTLKECTSRCILGALPSSRYSQDDAMRSSGVVMKLHNEIIGDVLKKVIDKVHEQLPAITGLPVKESAKDIYNSVKQKIQNYHETQKRQDPIHLLVGFNSLLCIGVEKVNSYDKDDFTISVTWTKDIEKLSNHWRSTLIESAKGDLDRFILNAIEEAATAIINPASGITYEEVAVIRPVDRKKETRVKFLRLLYKLKLYSMLTTTRNHVNAISIRLETKASSGFFSLWQYYYRYGSWTHRSPVLYSINYLGTLTSINDFVNSQILTVSKIYTKKQIRKLLFARIRTLLRYQTKSKVN